MLRNKIIIMHQRGAVVLITHKYNIKKICKRTGDNVGENFLI